MKGILWYVTRKLEGIFDGILMEFYIKSSEDKNQILKSMYIPRFLSSGLYGSFAPDDYFCSVSFTYMALLLLYSSTYIPTPTYFYRYLPVVGDQPSVLGSCPSGGTVVNTRM